MQLQKASVHDALNNSKTARNVAGYEGIYKITYNGMVYSYIKNKFLKPGLAGNGYLTVALLRKTHPIHTLVANAFIDNPENKKCVNHKNGVKVFNHIDNLEMATHRENNIHAFTIGLKSMKCTPDFIKEVLRLHIKADKQFGAKALAEKFGVNKCTITEIVKGRTKFQLIN